MLFLWQSPWYTQDGPNHLKVAVILRRLSTSPPEAAVYANHLGLLQTNSLFALLYQGLARFLSPERYERCFVGFFLVLLLVAFRCFLSVWAPANAALWVIWLPFCFHPLFLRGMYNYLASLPLTLVAFSLLHRGLAERRWSIWLLFIGACWAAFLAHPFSVFALGLGFLVMLVVQEKRDGGLLLLYGSVLGLFLGGGFLLPLWRIPPGMQTPYVFGSLPVLLSHFFLLNFLPYSGDSLLCMLPFVGMLLALLYRSVRESPWQQKGFWMAFLLGYLLFPREGSGGAHLNERFLPFLWFFLPVGLPPLEAHGVRKVSVVSLLTFLLAAGSVTWGMKTTEATVQEARRVLQVLPAQARLYPINFSLHDPGVLSANLTHVWAVYDHAQVVFSPYLFAFPSLTPLGLHVPTAAAYFPATEGELPERTLGDAFCRPHDVSETLDCRARRLETFQTILHNASYYDYWFLHVPPQEFLDLLAVVPGLQKMAESGGFSLWHYAKAKAFHPALPAP